MPASLEALTQVISGTPADEASFYSLAYIAALQQCTALAYQTTLTNITSSTGSSGVCGDGFTECITRVRLETERRVAGQLRTTLLLEQAAAAAARARERDGKMRARIDDDADPLNATNGQENGMASPSRRRASSVVAGGAGGSVNASSKMSRRGSRRASSSSSTAAGPRNSLQPGGLTSPLSGGRDGLQGASTPVNIAMAVKLLREGLSRAFGWSLPSSTLFTEGRQQQQQPHAPQLQMHGSRPEGFNTGHANAGSDVSAAQLKGLADTLLSRRAFAQTPTTTNSTPMRGAPPTASATPPLYMELEDDEGRQDILLEWMEDVLLFALHLHFNPPQTQCLLLDSLLALQVLDGAETHTASTEAGAGASMTSSISTTYRAEEEQLNEAAAWESRMAAALQGALCTQTCPTVTRVIETVQQRQPVVREVPDPVQLAELEQKRMKASTQKALAALDIAQAGIPLVRQTFMEDVSVEVERDATLPAVFSMAEAAAMVEFITRSAVMHRQLWQLVLHGTPQPVTATAKTTATALQLRPVVEVPLCALVEDVPPVFLPPLNAFYPAKLQGEVDAQQRVYGDCAAEKASLLQMRFEGPLAVMKKEELAERQRLVTAAQHAAADDRDAAMTSQECAHVERAFELRLHDTVARNTLLSRTSTSDGAGTFNGDNNFPAGAAAADSAHAASATLHEKGKAEAAATAMAASTSTTTATSAPESGKRKGKSSSAAGGAGGIASAGSATKMSASTSNLLTQSMLSADAAAAVPLPAGAVFSVAEVERRVDRIAAAAESLPNGGAAGAGGRGGPRKR